MGSGAGHFCCIFMVFVPFLEFLLIVSTIVEGHTLTEITAKAEKDAQSLISRRHFLISWLFQSIPQLRLLHANAIFTFYLYPIFDLLSLNVGIKKPFKERSRHTDGWKQHLFFPDPSDRSWPEPPACVWLLPGDSTH